LTNTIFFKFFQYGEPHPDIFVFCVEAVQLLAEPFAVQVPENPSISEFGATGVSEYFRRMALYPSIAPVQMKSSVPAPLRVFCELQQQIIDIVDGHANTCMISLSGDLSVFASGLC
jgi:hypothetical protein